MYPIFHQSKNLSLRQFTRSQSHCSKDEDYFNQNKQQYSNISRYKIDQPDNNYQPDNFEPFMNSEQTRQTQQHLPQRQNFAQPSKKYAIRKP